MHTEERRRPYSPAEVRRATERREVPDRGVYCELCRNFIPSFEVLSDQEAAAIRQAMQIPGQAIGAIRTLRERTGCSMLWAKIWLQHPDGPHAAPYDHPRFHLRAVDLDDCPTCERPLGPGTTRCWWSGCGHELPRGTFARGRPWNTW